MRIYDFNDDFIYDCILCLIKNRKKINNNKRYYQSSYFERRCYTNFFLNFFGVFKFAWLNIIFIMFSKQTAVVVAKMLKHFI